MEISLSPHAPTQRRKDRIRRLKAFFSLVFRYGITESNVIVNIHHLAEVEAIISTIGPWNTFNPVIVIETIKAIWPDISKLQIGCEGSPVIYVGIPLWTSQMNKNEEQRRAITQEEYEEHGLDKLLKSEGFMELNKKFHDIRNIKKLTESEIEEIKERVMSSFISTDPTEIDYKEKPNFPAIPYSIRIWWD